VIPAIALNDPVDILIWLVIAVVVIAVVVWALRMVGIIR
jgi:hypothetical protein